MAVRDARVLEAAAALPFDGYARRSRWVLAPDLERIVGCIVVVVTMVLSGVALGTPRDRRQLVR